MAALIYINNLHKHTVALFTYITFMRGSLFPCYIEGRSLVIGTYWP